LMETFYFVQSENIFHIIKRERPEWMNISRFGKWWILLMRESWKMFRNLFLRRALGVWERIYLCYYEMISLINHFTVYRFNLSFFITPSIAQRPFLWWMSNSFLIATFSLSYTLSNDFFWHIMLISCHVMATQTSLGINRGN
jgi:hypothetical protein